MGLRDNQQIFVTVGVRTSCRNANRCLPLHEAAANEEIGVALAGLVLDAATDLLPPPYVFDVISSCPRHCSQSKVRETTGEPDVEVSIQHFDPELYE